MQIRSPRLSNWMSLLLMTAGTVLVACGVYFFKFPNHFSTGGVSGLSILISQLLPSVSTGTIVMVVNFLLLIVGFAAFGRGFSIKTVYCTVLLSLLIRLLEIVVPLDKPLTSQPMLELFYSMMLPALGSAILFNMQASTGGTDILAMLLKRHTSMNIGNALFATDFLIAASACFVFSLEIGLFSLLGLLLKAMVVDLVIEGINRNKFFTIVTQHDQEVLEYIVKTLHRGATHYPATGAYSGDQRTVILCATSPLQAVRLRTFVRQIDAQAFLMITNTSEIIGKGFRGTV